MLPTTGSSSTAAICVALAGEAASELLRLVVFEHQRVLGGARGDAGRVGHAERGGRRAGRHQQAVDVAVVVAGKLDDLLAAGEAAGQPDGAHRRLGAAS